MKLLPAGHLTGSTSRPIAERNHLRTIKKTKEKGKKRKKEEKRGKRGGKGGQEGMGDEKESGKREGEEKSRPSGTKTILRN